jgi:hypothetical protein
VYTPLDSPTSLPSQTTETELGIIVEKAAEGISVGVTTNMIAYVAALGWATVGVLLVAQWRARASDEMKQK